MKIDKNYAEFIQSIKQQIVQSRYAAARLANREQLLLYFKTGLMISEKIKAQKWGAKVLEQISTDLLKELPGLKGFSAGNLKKIRLFAEAYSTHFNPEIVSIASNQLGFKRSVEDFQISSTLSNLIDFGAFYNAFFSISFSHHFTIITKIKGWDGRVFYLQSAATNFWSLTVLEHHIENDLFGKEGKLPNNFRFVGRLGAGQRLIPTFRFALVIEIDGVLLLGDYQQGQKKNILFLADTGAL